MADLAFIDTETTGLDPYRHEIWELAIITEDDEYQWQLPVQLDRADPKALQVGSFYQRRAKMAGAQPVSDLCRYFNTRSGQWGSATLTDSNGKTIMEKIAVLLDGRHLVGAVPSFDAAFLTNWFKQHHQVATWHYHLVDVEALVAGKMGLPPPWHSEDLSRAVGVDPDSFDRHTALGDARWAKAIYEAVMT